MLIEALRDFAFAHAVQIAVTTFVILAAFGLAFAFYPPAVSVLFKVVGMSLVACIAFVFLANSTFD